MKDFIKFFYEAGREVVTAIGWVTLTLLAMSLYPPLSFIPKFVLLFALTH